MRRKRFGKIESLDGERIARTIIVWDDRQIVVRLVTLDADEAVALAQRMAGVPHEDCWQIVDGHLVVTVEHRP